MKLYDVALYVISKASTDNLIFIFHYFILSIQSLISLSVGLDLKRYPSSQFPPFASFSSIFPLCPKPDDDEVQNGITLFPLKSFVFTNVSTGHAAIPHQIGYPINIVLYSSQLSTVSFSNFISLNDSSSCSLDTLEFLSVQSKTSDVYTYSGTISKISASNLLAIFSETAFVWLFAE